MGELVRRRILPVGMPIPEAEAVEYSIAIEYSGPPVPYDIPRAIPIEIERIPVASVVADPGAGDESDRFSLPVVQPLASPENHVMKRSPLVGKVKEEENEKEEAFPGQDNAVSPTSVIAFESHTVMDGLDRDMMSGEICSSSGNFPDRSRELSEAGCSEAAVGFSSEFKESVDFSSVDTNPPTDRVSTESRMSSEEFEFGFHYAASGAGDDDDNEVVEEEEEIPTYNAKLVKFQDVEASGATTPESGPGCQDRREKVAPKMKKGACHRCLRGNRFTEKEVCLVCGVKYCSNCVLRAMGSMPEGRKCVSCIGYPIDESKREGLGKCSRVLKRLLSYLEIQQVMKTEKFCEANQLRPEDVYVNGRQLSQEEMVLLQSCPRPPCKLKPGYYWYDKVSGLWGKVGHKPHKIISPHLNVGGTLMPEVSNGNTGIFINNREITKPELRMLQWANVQCAGSPHFWVNADGTYQEEGQKNIKGNLWEKAGIRLFCSVLSLPVPCKTTISSGEEVNHMASSVPDYLEQRTLQKLLLVGYHGSGTSTIFKQAKFRYKPVPFSEEEHETIKFTIQSNIYRYLGILLEARERFEDECLAEIRKKQFFHQSAAGENKSDGCDGRTLYSISPKLKAFSDWLLKAMVSGNLEAIFPAATREYAPLVEELWNDAAIQATYSRRSELTLLPDTASYFLERVVDVSRVEYEPSEMDILFAEGTTSSNGLTCLDFVFPPSACKINGIDDDDDDDQHETLLRYQLIRVHSRGLGENCKWLEMFEDVRMVIFCVDMSDYQEYCDDVTGATTNKMLASKKLFESIVTYPTFERMDFLLVLNKFDIFEKKVEQTPLTLCDWFEDFNPVMSRSRPKNNSDGRHPNNGASLSQMAFHYIAIKFKRLFAALTGRKLYVMLANGLDQDSVDGVLRYAREILKWEEERVVFGGTEYSAYSTEPSSYSQ